MEMLKTKLTVEAARGARLRVCWDEVGEGKGREEGRGRIRQQSKEVLLACGECPRSPGLFWRGHPGLLAPWVLVRGGVCVGVHEPSANCQWRPCRLSWVPGKM